MFASRFVANIKFLLFHLHQSKRLRLRHPHHFYSWATKYENFKLINLSAGSYLRSLLSKQKFIQFRRKVNRKSTKAEFHEKFNYINLRAIIMSRWKSPKKIVRTKPICLFEMRGRACLMAFGVPSQAYRRCYSDEIFFIIPLELGFWFFTASHL